MKKATSQSTLSILFFVRKQRIKKNGLVSLFIRITINGQQTEINSKLEINPSNWNQQTGKLVGRSKESLHTNSLIDKLKVHLSERFKYYLDRNGSVNLENMREVVQGTEEENTQTLLKLFDKKINQKEHLVGTGISKETLQKYKATKKLVKDFIAWYYQKTDLSIREVQYDFITNYDIYLQSQCKHQHNTKVRHLRYLKQIISDAYMCKYIQTDPFYNFKLTSKKTKKEILTAKELELIMNKKFSVKRLEQVRDTFVFQCFTGLAYVDVAKLKRQDFEEIKDAETKNSKTDFFTNARIKTGNEAYVPLLDIPLMIINKYKDLPNGKLLPIHACQKMNEYLKEIAALCGINKNLTTHCGRHTFATFMTIYCNLLFINLLDRFKTSTGNG